MKKVLILVCFILIGFIFIPVVFAQSTPAGFRGQSMNGTTGLFFIPTGRIGWDEGIAAFDFGFRSVINDGKASHIPAVTVSLIKFIEVSAALDIQPNSNSMKEDDFLMGIKVKLPIRSPVAIGTNIQMINLFDDSRTNVFQPYIAITYSGTFINMNAETTLVFGKTFYSGQTVDSSIDFGMGFDIILFPDVFKNFVHWIIDFSNFSYSADPWGGNAGHRGVLNTGFRIDLSAMPALNKYKFLIDVIFNDLFDDGSRSFTVGAMFGFSL